MLKRILNYWQRCSLNAGGDEMAYHPGTHLAYGASRHGEISVAHVAAKKLTLLGSVPDERGAGSNTVDPKALTVWIACHKGDECFVQPLTPSN